jgi:TRAP-type C4-dicarboxylate transport system permease small subunit
VHGPDSASRGGAGCDALYFQFTVDMVGKLAVFVMIWLTFIGSLICMRDKEHIEVTILVDHLPHTLQRMVIVFSRLASIFFLLIVAYYGLELVRENMTVTSPANKLSMGLVYTIIPLSSLGMVFYLVKAIAKGE